MKYSSTNLFPYKYFAITLGSIVALASFLYKKTLFSDFAIGYKYGVIVNLFFYIWYIISKFNQVVLSKTKLLGLDEDYITISLMIIATFLQSYTITNLLSVLIVRDAVLWLVKREKLVFSGFQSLYLVIL